MQFYIRTTWKMARRNRSSFKLDYENPWILSGSNITTLELTLWCQRGMNTERWLPLIEANTGCFTVTTPSTPGMNPPARKVNLWHFHSVFSSPLSLPQAAAFVLTNHIMAKGGQTEKAWVSLYSHFNHKQYQNLHYHEKNVLNMQKIAFSTPK